MTSIQKLAWIFAVGFLFIFSLNYIPGLTDEHGILLGLFKIDPIDDVVHLLSGAAAAFAAWRSPRAAALYFRIFGTLYGLDAVIGLIRGIGTLDVATNVAVNLPHVIISSIALASGFWLAERLSKVPAGRTVRRA